MTHPRAFLLIRNTVTIGDVNVETQIVSAAAALPATARRISLKIGTTIYTLLADP